MYSYASGLLYLSIFLSLITQTIAQTYTSCDPLEETCASDPGLESTTFSTDFTSTSIPANWTTLNDSPVSYTNDGVELTIESASDAPTLITSFYIFFGYVEVTMRASPGTGIVSAIVLESDDLDEIDWELFGSSPTSAQSNFFGKGNTTTYDRAQMYTVSSTTDESHTYAINWTSSSITWSVDGVILRTLLSTDASTVDGKNYPQTPSRLKIGSWAAGASDNEGTVEWAGGETVFSDGPFTMIVENVTIVNYNPAESYTYGDESGDWSSIEINGGSSEDWDSRVVRRQTDSMVSNSTDVGNSTTSLFTSTASSSSTFTTATASASTTTTQSGNAATTTAIISPATSVAAYNAASRSNSINSLINYVMVAMVISFGTFIA